MSDSPAKRLALFRKSIGMNQRDLAASLGFSPGRIGMIESGASQPSRNFLQKLSERYGLNPAWLLEGHEPMIHTQKPGFIGRQTQTQITPPDRARPSSGDFAINGKDFVFVRRMALDASAGSGLVAIEGETTEDMAFSASWMSRLGLNSDLCGLVRVRGDSMAPTIPDGALVLIHAAERFLEREGIYAFSIGEEVFVKRLTPVQSGHGKKLLAVMITSDNPSYPARTMQAKEMCQLRIAGRVRCSVMSFT